MSSPPLGTIPLSTGNTSLAPAWTSRLAQQSIPEPDLARSLLALCLLSQNQSLASEERPFQVEASDARHVPFWCCWRIPARCVVADLWWRVRLINTDILEEEARAGVFDPLQPTYPLLALNLRARRDNLVSTIGVLEQRARSTSEAA